MTTPQPLNPNGTRRDRDVLADAVFRQLGAAIVRGEYPEGARIRIEELEDKFHTSRTPIREAILRLERIGLLELAASKFTRVTVIDSSIVDSAREVAGYQAGVAASMAIPRMSDEEIAAACALADRVPLQTDPQAASHARRQLFSFFSQRAGNPVHDNMLREIELVLERSLAQAPLPEDNIGANEHLRALSDAIATRNVHEAERRIRLLHGIPVEGYPAP